MAISACSRRLFVLSLILNRSKRDANCRRQNRVYVVDFIWSFPFVLLLIYQVVVFLVMFPLVFLFHRLPSYAYTIVEMYYLSITE